MWITLGKYFLVNRKSWDYKSDSNKNYKCHVVMTNIYIYIYGLVREMPKSARYHTYAAEIVGLHKRLPQRPVSSKRNHQEPPGWNRLLWQRVEVKRRYIYRIFTVNLPVLEHSTPASSPCPQLLLPHLACKHVLKFFSLPLQCTSSNQIRPEPSGTT